MPCSCHCAPSECLKSALAEGWRPCWLVPGHRPLQLDFAAWVAHVALSRWRRAVPGDGARSLPSRMPSPLFRVPARWCVVLCAALGN